MSQKILNKILTIIVPVVFFLSTLGYITSDNTSKLEAYVWSLVVGVVVWFLMSTD